MADDNDFDAFDIINTPSHSDNDLAALLFAETAPPPKPDATQTVAEEKTLIPAAKTEETPKKPGLLARLKGLFRRTPPAAAEAVTEEISAPMEESAAEEAPAKKPGLLARLRRSKPEAAEEALPLPEAGETEEIPTPGKSHKKILVIALAALALLGIGVGGTLLTFQRMETARQAEWQKKEAELAAQKAQLEKQQAELAAMKAQNEKAAQEAAAAKASEQPQSGAAAPSAVASKPSPDAGDVDCAVMGKETAAQTMKRCIEAYNRATGRTK